MKYTWFVKRFSFRYIISLIGLTLCFTLNAQEWAVVKTAVTSLRTEPRHASEMCTQAGMGTPMKLIKKNGSWWHVKLPDEYTGYVPANTIQTMSQKEFDQWRSCRKVMVADLESSLIDENGSIVSDLVVGNVLQILNPVDAGGILYDNEGNSYIYILTPDNRTGMIYVDNELNILPGFSRLDQPSDKELKFDADLIIDTAKSMLGRVYLWGGTSPKMMDCSGLVKVCYLANGIILRRDASQQALTGQTVDDIANAKKGDLLFFGTTAGKVNHVGIYIGNGKFIHSSGQVKINSLNPSDKDYIKYNLLKIKRIDGMVGTDGIWSIYNHPWYNLK